MAEATKTKANVPLMSVEAQHFEIQKELEQGFKKILKASDFILGPAVKEFEAAFAQFVGAKHCIGVSNGTDAISLALLAAGVKAGDEVVVPGFSFVASATAVAAIGAVPVFADINPKTYTIDEKSMEKAISKKTMAVIPVHLFGHPADMSSVMEVATKKKLAVIEDCAQAHGSFYESKHVGTFGTAGIFSFYPSKNLGAIGDAGAIVTDNDKVAEMVRILRNQGQRVKYHSEYLGYNHRLDSLQAMVLTIKMRKLTLWNNQRREAARMYAQGLKGLPLQLPFEAQDCTHVYHLYVIKTKRRDELQKFLNENGISTGVYYPVPMHLHKCFDYLKNKKGSLPVSEESCKTVLALPMFPGIGVGQVNYVCSKIKEFFR